MNTVKTMTHEQQERLRSALTAGGGIEDPELPVGTYFLTRSEGSVVTAYRSGKVLFQGQDSDRQVRLAEGILGHVEPASKGLEFPIVGGDESGKGDLFGPLVVAAFTARDESERREVVRSGARDCKLMTDAEVRAVATRLDGIGMSSIRVLMPQEYNSRYARVHNVNVLLNEVYAGYCSNWQPHRRLTQSFWTSTVVERWPFGRLHRVSTSSWKRTQNGILKWPLLPFLPGPHFSTVSSVRQGTVELSGYQRGLRWKRRLS